MRDLTFSRSKYNITWISMLVILLGTIIYPVAFHHARAKNSTPIVQSVVPYPVTTINVQPIKPALSSTVPAKDPVVKPAAKTNLVFTRDLKLGDRGSDVKKLQEYLNQRGFIVAASGNGSPGQESELFGPGTASALKKFQESYAEILLKPYGLTEGTGFFGTATRNFISS